MYLFYVSCCCTLHLTALVYTCILLYQIMRVFYVTWGTSCMCTLYSMVFFHVRLFETVFSCFTSKASIKRQVLLVSFHFLFSEVSGRDQKCIGVSISHQW